MKDMQIGVYDNFATTIKSKATRIENFSIHKF